ncbi:MAG TPA: MFS transporter [Myxococcales bacterium]|nr:MFS transporter [Myxococcales bacterium]
MDRSFTARRLFGVLRDNRGFRRLYAANAVSQMGDWFNIVALFSLLLELTGKGGAVAFALLTRFVPAFLAGPAAGVLADRVSRRAIMAVSDLLRAALVLCLLFVRRPDQAWIAYAVITAHSLVSAFFDPAQQAMLPNLVAEEDYPFAATLENSLWAATLAVGSALGGFALALLGRDAAFLCDAASFLASAALIARLPAGHARRADRQAIEAREEARDPGSRVENLLGLRDLAEGVRYMVSHRRVRALLAVKASFGLTLGGVLVLLAYFGEKVFDYGNGAGIAVLYSARGVGSFAGPFAAFRVAGTDDRGLRRGIGLAFALLVVCYVGFALSPALGYAAFALAAANAGGSILWTSGSTLLQRLVPDAVRGRVAAAEMGGFMLTLAASTLATGLLLDRGVPPRALMAACGLVALVPLAYWASAQSAFEVTAHRSGE